MTLRRLIPYVVVFLILAVAYGGLRWSKERQVARDAEAKKVFHLQEGDLSDLSLVRGQDEVRLVKKDQVWHLTAPLNTRADQTVVDSMLTTLARLRQERDLGVEKDLKPFGLDKPGLVVKFTAQGQPHQLVIGARVPGDQNYYALRDQDPHLLMISMGSKDSLDRQLLALRDKILLSFIMGEVKGLKVKSPKSTTALSKTGPQTWVWVEHPDFRVRGDRVEKLLRDLHIARAKNFLEPPPEKLKPLDLDPDHRTEVTVATSAGDRTLWLGAKKDDAVYGRLGPAGAMVLVDAALADEVNKTLKSLEDRRLWSGSIAAVHQVVWGPPGKTWTARKDQGAWKINGPGQAATQQPAARLEMALWNFQKLEAAKKVSPQDAPKGPSVFELELLDQDGKPLLHLEEMGAETKAKAKGKDKSKNKSKDRDKDRDHLAVRTGEGQTSATVLIPQASFRQWQAEMQRLTAAAEPGGAAPEEGTADQGSKK